MGEVLKFFTASNPDDVLEQAKGVYQEVFIIGLDGDGEIDARSSTGLSEEKLCFILAKFKGRLLLGYYDVPTAEEE